jgi:putative aldouronate transport system substrate-binding protein
MVSRDGNYMGLNSEGTPVFVPAQENYKEAVIWMHDLWESGAVDPEYFTQESSAQTSKQQAEGGSQVGLVFGWTADAQVSTNADQFSLLEAVEGYDGTHYVECATDYLDISDREFMITTACEDPEALLRWADGFYTDLASLQTFYGTIGSQITDNGDGTYTVDVPEDGSSLDTSAWSNSFRDFGPKYMNQDFYDNVTLPADQGDGIKLAEDEVNAQYIQTDKNCGLPLLQYTEDELSSITTIGTDIYNYVEAQYAHWVVDGGIEDEWDAYIEQLNAMGLEEFVEIQTTAYNAYLENLAE